MPKKKKSTGATVPEWFPKLLDTAPYTTVQVAPEEVEEWLDDLAQGYRSSEARDEIDRCFRQLFAFQDRHRKTLGEVNWSQYSGHQLVWWVVAEMTLWRAIETFLPPPYDQLSPSARTWCYLFQLIVTGTAEAEKPQTQHPDPLELARTAVHVGLAGPYARQEAQRCMKQHVGSPVGELLFWRAVDAMSDHDGLVPVLEEGPTLQDILDKLRKCSWRKAKQRVSQVVQDDGLVTKTLKTHLSSEIYETVVKRWGGLDGLDALARSLDGKFHYAPKIIAERLMDPRKLREIFPVLDERRSVRLPAAADDSVVSVKRCVKERVNGEKKEREYECKPSRFTLSITEEDPSYPSSQKRQADKVLADFLKRHPEHEDGIQLLLSDEPLKDLAQARGVKTVQTIINRKKKAQEALKGFAKWDHS